MFAIFKNNEYIKNSDIPDPILKSLEIGKDIQWQIIIRRNGKILDIDKKELKDNDIIIRIYWKVQSIEITREGKRKTIREKDLLETDRIEQKNYIKKTDNNIIGYRICRGGDNLQINSNEILKTDIIVKEFAKERIKTNENNEFLLKTDQELIEEFQEKCIKIYAENINKQSIIDGTAQNKIDDYKKELNKIKDLNFIRMKYKNLLVNKE